eukprot:SAG31_NODE_29116_length_400_cov_1.182724_1_plen_60_part_10
MAMALTGAEPRPAPSYPGTPTSRDAAATVWHAPPWAQGTLKHGPPSVGGAGGGGGSGGGS